MPVAGRETWDSRKVKVSPQTPDSVLRYIVTGTFDPEEVNTWLAANVPALYGVLWLQDFDIDPQGGGCWFVDAQYGDVRRDGMGKPDGTGAPLDPQGEPTPPAEPNRPPDEEGLGPEYSFEVTGEPVRITQSRDIASSISSETGVAPPDCHFAIGLTKDSVEGVDKEVGILQVSETRKFRRITRKYLDTLTEMCGTVCDSKGFWGWKHREVKFDGASGQGHNDGTWTVTFRFSIRKTRFLVPVAQGMVLGQVAGWDYIDVLYGKEIDADTLLRVPVAAYVHVIFDESDFSKLGIGK